MDGMVNWETQVQMETDSALQNIEKNLKQEEIKVF